MYLETTLGQTASLIMDLIPGTSGRAFFDRILGGKSAADQRELLEVQNRFLKALAFVQIELATFNTSTHGILAKKKKKKRRQQHGASNGG